MKCVIKDKEKEVRLPGIGQLWCHSPEGPVYLRIRDDQGKKALGKNPRGYNSIYSVCLEDGVIRETPLSGILDITVLVPKEGHMTVVQA